MSPHGRSSSTACSFWRTSTPPFATAFGVPLHYPKHLFFKLIPVSRWIGRLSEVTRPADDASEDRPSTELICNPRAWQKADGHCCDNLDFPSSHVGINLNLYIFTTKRSYKLYPRLCHLLSLDLIKKQYYQLLFHWWRNMQNEQN